MKFLIALLLILPLSVRADQVEILDEADKIFRSKMDIIENPQGNILLGSDFLYRDDLSSKMKLAALIDSAKKGVVSLNIVDAPHLMLNPAYIKVAEEAGVKFRIYNSKGLKFLEGHKRYHNKLTATKGMIQTGGSNTGDEYHGLSKGLILNDRDALVKGEETWKQVHDDFMKMWNSDWVVDAKVTVLSKEEVEALRAKLKTNSEKMKKNVDMLSKLAPVPITFDTNDPTLGSGMQYVTQEEVNAARADLEEVRKKWRDLKIKKSWDKPAGWFKDASPHAAVELCADLAGKGKCSLSTEGIYDVINKSKKSLTISSPYFIPTPRMLKALKDAKERGVKVVFLTNSDTSGDNPLTQKSYYLNRDKIAALGIDVLEYQGTETLHAKSIVADADTLDAVYTAGGWNVDPRSEKLNTELVLKIKNDPTGAKKLQQSIERDMKRAVLVATGGKVIVPSKPVCKSLYEKVFMKLIEHQL